MIDVLEVFDGVKNVEFTGVKYCKEVGEELPAFTLAEESVEDWNAKAEMINTKSFIRMTGNLPANYSEVKEWVRSLILDTEKAAAVTATSLAQLAN